MDTLELRKKRRTDMEDAEVKELQHSMTVRERLERKLQTDEIKLELEDDLGKFILRFRKLSPVEHDKFVALQRDLANVAKDVEKTKEITEVIYSLLGSISLDGLDAEFWKSGTGYSPDILVSVVLKVMAASSYPDKKYIDEIIKFRQQ